MCNKRIRDKHMVSSKGEEDQWQGTAVSVF